MPIDIDAQLFNQFSSLRNRLRYLNAEEVFNACFQNIKKEIQVDVQHVRRYPPWGLLLLMKWAYQESMDSYLPKRALHQKQFERLVNGIHELDGLFRMKNHCEIFLFFKMKAFQQFWFQDNFIGLTFARQIRLFEGQRQNGFFESEFLQATGISVVDFHDLAFGVISAFQQNPNVLRIGIQRQWFDTIAHSFSANTIDAFLEKISISLPLLSAYWKKNRPQARKLSEEFLEQTSLLRTPLLKNGIEYLIFKPQILFVALNYFVYGTLRDLVNRKTFFFKFGNEFEVLVGECIRYVKNANFHDENSLRQMIGSGCKVVDYLFENNGSLILVESKATKMAAPAMSSADPNVVLNLTKSTVYKAVQQGMSTIRRVNQLQSYGPGTRAMQKYLLIVTFQELYLSNGNDYMNCIAPVELQKLTQEFGTLDGFDFENIFILPISEFETLVSLQHDGVIEMDAVLARAVTRNRVGVTKKFMFYDQIRDDLDNGPNLSLVPYLETAKTQLMARLQNRF